MGALAVILGMLAVTGVVRPWHVYVLAFGLGLATVVDNPTRQSFAIEMVGKADLHQCHRAEQRRLQPGQDHRTGCGWAGDQPGRHAGRLLPQRRFLRGSAHRAQDDAPVRTSPPAERVERAKGQLREGLATCWSRPDLLMTMVLIFFVATFGMNFGVTTALMSRVVFHTGAGKFGIASAVFAFGALIGALVAARRSKTGHAAARGDGAGVQRARRSRRAFMPTYWLFLVVLVPTGLTVISLSTAANASSPAQHARRDARPGHGHLHARVPWRCAARRAADRLGGAGASAPGQRWPRAA